MSGHRRGLGPWVILRRYPGSRVVDIVARSRDRPEMPRYAVPRGGPVGWARELGWVSATPNSFASELFRRSATYAGIALDALGGVLAIPVPMGPRQSIMVSVRMPDSERRVLWERSGD